MKIKLSILVLCLLISGCKADSVYETKEETATAQEETTEAPAEEEKKPTYQIRGGGYSDILFHANTYSADSNTLIFEDPEYGHIVIHGEYQIIGGDK